MNAPENEREDSSAARAPAGSPAKAAAPRWAFAVVILAVLGMVFLGIRLLLNFSGGSESVPETPSAERVPANDVPEDALPQDMIFKFAFSRDDPIPEINVGGWNWIYNTPENGAAERPVVGGGVAEFSCGGARSEGKVEFDCGLFACAFEIAAVRNERPAIVVAFGDADEGQTVAEPGFYVKVSRDSIQLEDQKTGEIVAEAKGVALGDDAFKKILVLNTPRGSAIFADGNAVARSKKSVSGRAFQVFGIGGGRGLPGVGRYKENYGKLEARLRSAAVFGRLLDWPITVPAETIALDAEDAVLYAERGISLGKTFAPAAPAVSAGELTGFLGAPVFRFDFSRDSPTPEVNVRGRDWYFYKRSDGVVEKPGVSDGVAEFSIGGAYTRGSVSFDCSAFSCEFEIANVRNAVPAIVCACGRAEIGGIPEEPGFFVKISRDAVQLENQETGEIVVEARGLDFGGNAFRRVSVVNAPAGSSVVVDGVVVAHSEKSISGTAVSPFGIGGGHGLPGGVSGRAGATYEKLNAQLRSVALFSGRSDAESTRRVPSLYLLAETAADAAFAAAAGTADAGTAETAERRKKTTPADANYTAKWPNASRIIGYYRYKTIQKGPKRFIYDTKSFRIIFSNEFLIPIRVREIKEITRILELTRAAAMALPIDSPCRHYDAEKDGRYIVRIFGGNGYIASGGKSAPTTKPSIYDLIGDKKILKKVMRKEGKDFWARQHQEPYYEGTYLAGSDEKPGLVLTTAGALNLVKNSESHPSFYGAEKKDKETRFSRHKGLVEPQALVREVSRQMIDPAGEFPPWLSEGLVQYMTYSYTYEKRRGWFQFQRNWIPFRKYLMPHSCSEYEEFRKGSWKRYIILLKIDPETFFTSEKKLGTDGNEGKWIAASAALVYYFIHLDGNRDGARIKKYIEAVRNGESPEDALELLLDGRSWQTLLDEIRRRLIQRLDRLYVGFDNRIDPTADLGIESD